MGEILVENAQYYNLRSNTDFKKKTALALAYKTENLIFQDLELGKLCQDALKTVTVSRNVNWKQKHVSKKIVHAGHKKGFYPMMFF